MDTDPLGVDRARLRRWFAEHVGVDDDVRYTPVLGGHSCLTFTVDTTDGRRFVLRRPPLGHALATAHDVLREHRVITALADTAVPVAPVVGSCADPEVTGAPFYVMEFVDGVVLHDRSAAETLTEAARGRAARSMIDVLVELQRVDPDEVGLGDLAKRTDYLGRQLRRWHAQWESSRTRPMPRMAELHAWLVAHRPDEGASGIVHGDFRLGNAIHRNDGTVAALLDWELCTLGPRPADVSYLLRTWADETQDAPSPDGVAATASSAPGFPSRDELAGYYAHASGQPLADREYWIAFQHWRSACIVAGVFTRYRSGQLGEPPADYGHFEDDAAINLEAGLTAAALV